MRKPRPRSFDYWQHSESTWPISERITSQVINRHLTQCYVCSQSFPPRADGKVPRHHRDGVICYGSNQTPSYHPRVGR